MAGSLKNRKGQASDNQRKIRDVAQESPLAFCEPSAEWANHGIQQQEQAGGEARRIVAQGKMLSPQHLEAAMFEQRFQVRRAEMQQLARHVHAVPLVAEHEKLPASGVRYLDNQAAFRRQKAESFSALLSAYLRGTGVGLTETI